MPEQGPQNKESSAEQVTRVLKEMLIAEGRYANLFKDADASSEEKRVFLDYYRDVKAEFSQRLASLTPDGFLTVITALLFTFQSRSQSYTYSRLADLQIYLGEEFLPFVQLLQNRVACIFHEELILASHLTDLYSSEKERSDLVKEFSEKRIYQQILSFSPAEVVDLILGLLHNYGEVLGQESYRLRVLEDYIFSTLGPPGKADFN
jgi:hypothetical protein